MTIAAGEKNICGGYSQSNFFPIGTILMYDRSGWTDNVTLKCWYKCDAANAAAGLTPDLTDKFIMGAAAKGAVCGSNSVTLLTANLPSHGHSLSDVETDNDDGHTHDYSGTSLTGGEHNHSLSGISLTGGAHGHTFSGTSRTGYLPIGDGSVLVGNGMDGVLTPQAGSGNPFDNQPSYYTLIYIRKCA
jgi:hypothetical protein